MMEDSMMSNRGSNVTEMGSSETGNIEREWTREFHGSTYQITLSMTYGTPDSDHDRHQGNSMIGTALLRLEVELLDCDNSHGSSSVNERWYGEFTAQYIEEITHKAGNFKKCPVFVKMLSAAFTEEHDTVLFVDLLTYSDLELLKARKNGTSTSSSSSSSSSSSLSALANKRYVILTYSGEFDRVHYPLPLVHEDPNHPNVTSLRRTINKLRQQVKEQGQGPGMNSYRGMMTGGGASGGGWGMSHISGGNESFVTGSPTNNATTITTTGGGGSTMTSEKDRERDNVRQIITQLRQDNTELRHRLRQAERQAAKGPGVPSAHTHGPGAKGTGGGVSGTTTAAVAREAELLAANSKLRKQVESLRQELSASTAAYERLRVEAARDTAKLKHRLSAALTGAPGQGLGPGDRVTDEKSGLASGSVSASASGGGLGGGRGRSVRPPPPGEDREGVLIRRIAALERDLAMMTRQTTHPHTGRQTRASSKTPTPTPTTTSIASVFSSTATAGGGKGAGRGTGGGSLSRPARSTTPPVQRGRGSTPTSSSVYGSGGSRGSVGGGSGGRVPPRHLSPSPTAMGRTNNTHNNHVDQPRRSTSSAGSSHSTYQRPPTPPRSVSAGGVFDPLAYQRNKDEAKERRERGLREWERSYRTRSGSGQGYGSGYGSGGSVHSSPMSEGRRGRSRHQGPGQGQGRPRQSTTSQSLLMTQKSSRGGKSGGGYGSNYGSDTDVNRHPRNHDHSGGSGEVSGKKKKKTSSSSSGTVGGSGSGSGSHSGRRSVSTHSTHSNNNSRYDSEGGYSSAGSMSRPPLSATRSREEEEEEERRRRKKKSKSKGGTGGQGKKKSGKGGEEGEEEGGLVDKKTGFVASSSSSRSVMQEEGEEEEKVSNIGGMAEVASRQGLGSRQESGYGSQGSGLSDWIDNAMVGTTSGSKSVSVVSVHDDDKENQRGSQNKDKEIFPLPVPGPVTMSETLPHSVSFSLTASHHDNQDTNADGSSDVTMGKSTMQPPPPQKSFSSSPSPSHSLTKTTVTPTHNHPVGGISSAGTTPSPSMTSSDMIKSPSTSLRTPPSTMTTTMVGEGSQGEDSNDISEIDRRILALQNYLESARVGILRESIGGNT